MLASLIRATLICAALGVLGTLAAQPPLPPPDDQPAKRDQQQPGVKVAEKGPIHEAFADPLTDKVNPPPVVAKQPPAAVEEMPPEQKPVVITGELTTGPLVAVDFSPHGLTFAKPVLLQMAYTQCGTAGAAFDSEGDGKGDGNNDGKGDGHHKHGSRHEVVYVGPDEGILEHLPSTDDALGAAVSAWLSHFSRYAVYY